YAQYIFLDYDNHIVEQRAGKQLAQSSYSWKNLMNKGVTVSNGSDAPVEMPDVMRGIECAVTRCSLDKTGPYLPEEAFTVKEAIDSFTKYGAAASFEENVKGRIKENYYADFVILDKNPFEEDKFSLHDIKILKTFVNGKCVYDREETL
ncbi:MAG: amidohydrolase family protein, partial [Erysipelotrichaceae bacterium]|nr:amidohydrolase family protein [Erysipelotrichaceae bacterium]